MANYNVFIKKIKPLLTDEVALKRYEGESPSHVAEFSTPVAIRPCKVEETLKTAVTGNDENSDNTILAFFYTAFTGPLVIEPKDVILYNKKEYRVTSVSKTVVGLEVEGVENG